MGPCKKYCLNRYSLLTPPQRAAHVTLMTSLSTVEKRMSSQVSMISENEGEVYVRSKGTVYQLLNTVKCCSADFSQHMHFRMASIKL